MLVVSIGPLYYSIIYLETKQFHTQQKKIPMDTSDFDILTKICKLLRQNEYNHLSWLVNVLDKNQTRKILVLLIFWSKGKSPVYFMTFFDGVNSIS